MLACCKYFSSSEFDLNRNDAASISGGLASPYNSISSICCFSKVDSDDDGSDDDGSDDDGSDDDGSDDDGSDEEMVEEEEEVKRDEEPPTRRRRENG
jgi:hypothetical protein